MTEFEIRRLTPDDADAANAALDALLPADWREGALPSPERMREVLADTRVILIVAHAGGGAAGYVSGHVLPALHRDGSVVMLDDLFVAEPFRRRGLGRRLVDAFKKTVHEIAPRPLSMWSGTGVGNIACRRAFEAAGGEAEEDVYKEFAWVRI